ncbi:unnamed protein product, partial [Polarella glacialis]
AIHWDSQNAECSSGRAGRCEQHTPPFAAAAYWAAGLVTKACDGCEQVNGQLACDVSCSWEKQPATWRYVLNNLRLAVEAAAPEYRSTLGSEVHDQLLALHSFVGELGSGVQTWLQNWQLASASVRELLEFLRPWLLPDAYRPGLPLLVPSNNHGLRFPTPTGRSVQVPTDGDIGARVVLANGVAMPLLGLGVAGLSTDDAVAYQSVRWALEIGYRHIDTAEGYGNEREVGRALRDSGVPRQEIFLVTKLSQFTGDAAAARRTFETQLRYLQVEYVDLYMLHHPGKDVTERMAIWRELEALHNEGRIRALGVSNFGIDLLEELFSWATVKPVYVQNKFTIYQPGDVNEALKEDSLMEWLTAHRVVMTGFSVINPTHWSGYYLEPLSDPHVTAIAGRVGRSPSQVLHRWLLQLGAAVIPRSTKRERILENAQVFDFALSEAEMRVLSGLASLAASSPGRRSPAWCEDVYGLARLTLD